MCKKMFQTILLFKAEVESEKMKMFETILLFPTLISSGLFPAHNQLTPAWVS